MAFFLAMHSTPLNHVANTTQTPVKVSANSRAAQDLVNQHLWVESKMQDLEIEKASLANQRLAPQVSQFASGSSKAKYNVTGVDHSLDRFENNAFQDLNRYPKFYNLGNPDSIIQKQLFDAQAQSEIDATSRQAYANQFIENARSHGYEVKLDANYVVTSVKPIPPSLHRRPSLFEAEPVSGVGTPTK